MSRVNGRLHPAAAACAAASVAALDAMDRREAEAAAVRAASYADEAGWDGGLTLRQFGLTLAATLATM